MIKDKRVLIGVLIVAMFFFVSDTMCETIRVGSLSLLGATAAESMGSDLPMGQSANSNQPSLLPEDDVLEGEGNIFGLEGGYFHPFLSLQGEYTDNLYNISQNETSNFLTIISPGIWFALPRKRDIPIAIALNNTSPGGLQQQLKDYEGTDRYQAYMGGGLDFLFYSEDSDLNGINGLLEGMFRYNLKSGLSLQILDRYSRAQNIFDVGSVLRDSVGRFDSNIFMATADWVFTEKTRVKVDYSNFWLGYDEDIDAFQNRTDDAIDLYGYYIHSEKTSFFLQYKYVIVAYDEATINDNTQNFYYGGITWYTTEKVALMAKAGWQEKLYDSNGTGLNQRDDTDGFVFDIQATYKFTEKTNLVLSFYQHNQESDSTIAANQDVLGVGLKYSQELSQKITFKFDFDFLQAEYDQLVARDRDDDTYAFRPSLSYLFRDWLKGELAYEYRKRESTDDLFDYDTNTFILNLSLAL